jgi:hypothetical protein
MPEFAGVSDKVANPAWATSVGLMLVDLEAQTHGSNPRVHSGESSKPSVNIGNAVSKITGVFRKFRT